jgi:hypothetical protein
MRHLPVKRSPIDAVKIIDGDSFSSLPLARNSVDATTIPRINRAV